jgi:DNA-binding MarR family transcriptional regulator
MFTTVLSYSESAVLAVVGQTGEAYLTEIPSRTQLPPYEVTEALDGLAEKSLVVSENGGVRVTKGGRNVLKGLSARQFSRPNRVLVTDRIAARAIQTNAQSVRLNESIDEELKKL